MAEAAERQVQETDDQLELTPEQVEELLFEEAAALVDAEDEDATTFDQSSDEVEEQADPEKEAVAEDREEETSREAQSTEAAPPDPFADATPEQRQAWQQLVQERARLEHEAVSNRNRVSGLQRKINELEAQQKAKPKPAEPEAKPAEKADLADDDDGDDLKEFQEDFPEIYKAVNRIYQQQLGRMEQGFEAKLNQINEKLQTVAQPVEQMRQSEEERYRRNQLDALQTAHPDWRQIQDSNKFWNWVETQTDGVKALAGSAAANDNIVLLNLYKSAAGIQQQPAPTPREQAHPARPRRQPDVALPRVNSGGRPAPGGPPKDGDKALDYWLDRWDEL